MIVQINHYGGIEIWQRRELNICVASVVRKQSVLSQKVDHSQENAQESKEINLILGLSIASWKTNYERQEVKCQLV